MKKKLAYFASLLLAGLMVVSCAKEKPANPDDPTPVDPTPTTGHTCNHVCPSCGKCTDPNCKDPKCLVKCDGLMPVREKHLITDSNGDYGGGTGAPKNGQYDNLDAIYYTYNDYYNLKCTSSRTLIPEFAPYQQTKDDSGAAACAVMILNYEGLDVENQYTEDRIYTRINELKAKSTEKTSYGKEVEGVFDYFRELGYDAGYHAGDSTAFSGYDDFSEWIVDNLKDNRYIMVQYQDGIRYQWHIIIGIDTMGTSGSTDDVLIFADPFDASDHYQDGYSIYHLQRMYHWYLEQHEMGQAKKDQHEYVTIEAKEPFMFVKQAKDDCDPVKCHPEYAPYNMLTNKDGTCGGYYYDGRYSVKAGQWEYNVMMPGSPFDPTVYEQLGKLDYSYFTYNDYSHMDDTDSLYICKGYRPFKQTMASSCGICSTMTSLEYYGFDWSTIGNYIKRTDFCGYDKVFMPEFGPVDDDDNGRKQEAVLMLYCNNDSSMSSPITDIENLSCKFYSYGGVGASKLSGVSKQLGFTNVTYNSSLKFHDMKEFHDQAMAWLALHEPTQISWNPTGGHWEVLIGYDDMGTPDFYYDDVVVLGDSSDNVDHYRDGFNTLPAHVMLGTWYNGGNTTRQAYVHFTRDRKV